MWLIKSEKDYIFQNLFLNRQIDNSLTNFLNWIIFFNHITKQKLPETKGLPLLRSTSSGSPAVDLGRAANTAAFHTTNLGVEMRFVTETGCP